MNTAVATVMLTRRAILICVYNPRKSRTPGYCSALTSLPTPALQEVGLQDHKAGVIETLSWKHQDFSHNREHCRPSYIHHIQSRRSRESAPGNLLSAPKLPGCWVGILVKIAGKIVLIISACLAWNNTAQKGDSSVHLHFHRICLWNGTGLGGARKDPDIPMAKFRNILSCWPSRVKLSFRIS